MQQDAARTSKLKPPPLIIGHLILSISKVLPQILPNPHPNFTFFLPATDMTRFLDNMKLSALAAAVALGKSFPP